MPQPIDPNTEIVRTNAAERIQQATDRASLAGQARSANEAAKERSDAESQVRQLREKSTRVDEELRRRNPFLGRRRRKKRDGEESEDATHTFYNADERQEVVEDPEGHELDVTI